MNRLEGMHVVVTGAAGAIGGDVCRYLSAEGANLTVSDRPGTRLSELEVELPGSVAVPADTSRLSEARTLVAAAAAAHGPIDGLVNVAGFWQIIDFIESDEAQWKTMIDANLLTAMTTSHAVLPSMIDSGEGAIVNFASTAGEYGSIRPSAAYAAAKGGTIAFTKSLAREVSPSGIRVNAVSPGPIDTPMLRAASQEQRQIAAARTLVGRLGTGSDIAAAVCYLISRESSFVTGEVLRVNGGSLI